MREAIDYYWHRVRRKLHTARWRHFAIMGMMLASISIVLVTVLAWQLPYGNRLLMDVGEVATFNAAAPRQITYESSVLTERARDRAAQGVLDQYDTQEAIVRRQQVNQAREVLASITTVRDSPVATLAEKTDMIVALADLGLTAEVAVQILSLSGDEWARVVGEVPLAVDRVMRDEIRESSLPLIMRRVPMLIGSALSEPANDVAIVLAQSLIRPNSLINIGHTNELRAAARAEVPAQMVTLEEGEIIIRAGDVATPEIAEALQVVGTLQHEWNLSMVLRALIFAVVLLAVTLAALYRLSPSVLRSYTELALLLVVAVFWLLAAKFMIVNHPWLPYLYPLAAVAMIVAVLCDLRSAVVLAVALTLVVVFLSNGSAPLTAYVILGSLVGVLVVGRGERLNAFLWAGVAIAATNIAVLAAFWWPFNGAGAPAPLEMVMFAVLNGGLSAAIALIGYFVLGNLFDITTPLQLTELSRPTHPLLRQLLLKASGTYHHTILVSNMAERAAAAIGADALLVRVGAYYHDIGKTVRPYFFAENILDGSSPHEKLDPLTSAQIIISHVKDGLDLAQKYHLPSRIQDFIREHHGRSLVKYFYMHASRQAAPGEPVSEEDFRYPGPNPHSKETTILMLADTCEAAVRAVRPSSREDLEALVDRLIDERVMSGELDESSLTFGELQTVKSVFLQVLQGVHHPRIVYPEPANHERPTVAAAAGDGMDQSGAIRPLPGGIEESALRPSPSNAPAAVAAEG